MNVMGGVKVEAQEIISVIASDEEGEFGGADDVVCGEGEETEYNPSIHLISNIQHPASSIHGYDYHHINITKVDLTLETAQKTSLPKHDRTRSAHPSPAYHTLSPTITAFAHLGHMQGRVLSMTVSCRRPRHGRQNRHWFTFGTASPSLGNPRYGSSARGRGGTERRKRIPPVKTQQSYSKVKGDAS